MLNFREGDAFKKCFRYNLEGQSIPNNFESAMAQRSRMGLKEISCHSDSVPLLQQFTFDQSENIQSIVTDVSLR